MISRWEIQDDLSGSSAEPGYTATQASIACLSGGEEALSVGSSGSVSLIWSGVD
ncbi:MAG: hypothetical protein ACK5XV_02530 [Flavobacteriales bacterium]